MDPCTLYKLFIFTKIGDYLTWFCAEKGHPKKSPKHYLTSFSVSLALQLFLNN